MGACTFAPTANVSEGILDNKRVRKGILSFSNSYATGGDTLALGQTGLTEITQVLVDANNTSNQSGISIVLGGTKAAPLILAYDSLLTQVTAATDLSARNQPVWLVGA